jgi:hypothetical protein
MSSMLASSVYVHGFPVHGPSETLANKLSVLVGDIFFHQPAAPHSVPRHDNVASLDGLDYMI